MRNGGKATTTLKNKGFMYALTENLDDHSLVKERVSKSRRGAPPDGRNGID
jgi:hypothetical protein